MRLIELRQCGNTLLQGSEKLIGILDCDLHTRSMIKKLAIAFLLTRHSRPIIRFLWLVIGVLLLAPWPFILPTTGAAG